MKSRTCNSEEHGASNQHGGETDSKTRQSTRLADDDVWTKT